MGVILGAEIYTPKSMNIKRNIIFTLESRKKDGVLIVENVPIRMRVNFASKRIEFTTGYRIDAAKWDADKQRVKNGCSNKLKQSASEINVSLLGYYTEIQDIFKKFEVEEIMPTQEQIKEAFNALHKPIEEEVKPRKSMPNTFYKVFDEFVRDCGRQNDWTDSTYEKFAAVKNHLMNFRDELTFDFFDERGLNNYVTYLRDVKEMRNSTIGKQLSFLKWFLRWAFKKGVHQNNAYDSYKPKLKSTQKKIIFLTWEELNKLREFEIPTTKQAYGLIVHMVGDGAETVILRDGRQIVPAVVLTERLVVPHDALPYKTASDKRHVCKFVECRAHTDESPVLFSFFGHIFQQPVIVFLIHFFLA